MPHEKLHYPIGRFTPQKEWSDKLKDKCIESIAQLPHQLDELTHDLSAGQLSSYYRPEGWTVRQVIHHIADSHMNSYIRFKWTLTENTPSIKAYDEKAWSLLVDALSGPIAPSITLIKGLHQRWTMLLQAMSQSDYERQLNHPDWASPQTLYYMLQLYSWHGQHHLGHIRQALANHN